MKVTVLMAVFNGGAYLRDAVDSVLAQTYRDFELLLVDDASTDGAVDALPGDSRIRVLRNEENAGQVPSLNRGLAEARGEYVARLDADDVMLPERLERQAAVLDAEPSVALVGTWLDVVDEAGRTWSTVRGHVDDYAGFVAAILADRIPFGHPSLMYRRDVVLALGGYDASLAPSEDKDLYRRLALERREARVVAEPLVRYRRHQGQLSQAQTARQLAHDRESQERLLHELAPGLPARTLRLLLAGDPGFWTEPPLADVEALLAGATERLRLTPPERAEVAHVIAARCARTLLAGWSASSPGYRARAAAPATFVSAHGDVATRAAAALRPLVGSTRPLGIGLGQARTQARRALRNERLEPLRSTLRRSRILRRVYTKVLGFRLVDD
ncbi:MAG: glycosyltransferase family 2 protein [Gaiellaceae bacterium]